MKRSVKLWLMTATALTVVGLLIFAAVMTVYRWDFTRLGTEPYQTKTYEIDREFSDISVEADTAALRFAPAESGCRVVCRAPESLRCVAEVRYDTLTVRVTDERKWYERIGIFSDSSSITVYLPQAEYASLSVREKTGSIEIPKGLRFETVEASLTTGDVQCAAFVTGAAKITTTTGDIRVENTAVRRLELSATTGEITVRKVTCDGDMTLKTATGETTLTDVTCGNLSGSATTGDLSLTRVLAGETVTLQTDTGNVRLNASDAAALQIETDTGDVTGSLMSDKVFLTQTSTGRVVVPRSVTGGRCEITTDTGDIFITVQNKK